MANCFDYFETVASQMKSPMLLPGTVSNDVIRVSVVIKSGHSHMFREKKKKGQ